MVSKQNVLYIYICNVKKIKQKTELFSRPSQAHLIEQTSIFVGFERVRHKPGGENLFKECSSAHFEYIYLYLYIVYYYGPKNGNSMLYYKHYKYDNNIDFLFGKHC